MYSRMLAFAVVGGAVLTVALPLAAQQLPPSVEPGAPLPIAPAPNLAPPAAPLAIPPTSPGRVPPDADQVKLTLREIKIEGATAIGADELRAVYQARLGQAMTLADVFAIADDVTALYRGQGYILSRAVVPAQTIADGSVTIQVIEGYVSDVILEGEIGQARALVQSYLDKILASRPARLAVIERYLLLAGDVPGIKVAGTLRPGADLGSAELVVTATRKWYEGFATVNNRGSEFIGPWVGAAGASANSFTPLGEQTSVLGFTAWKPKEQSYGELDERFRLGTEGTELSGFYSYGPSEPGSFLDDLDVESRSTIAGVKLSHPFVRQRTWSLWLDGGYEWSKATSEVDHDRLFDDRMDILEAGPRVEFTDGLGGYNQAALQVRQGLGLPGTTKLGDDEKSRADASGVFTAYQAKVSRRQKITSSVELYLAGQGQVANDPLLTDAEIKFGGTDFLRGYPTSELTGDSGLGATAELRYSISFTQPFLKLVQLYGFTDYAKVWNKDQDTPPSTSHTSLGTGVRVLPQNWLFLELELAKGLDEQITGNNDAGERPLKLFFTATVTF